MKMMKYRRGVSLIELLITIVIGSIAMMALSVPFMSERIFWLSGDAQAESQRDAQVALRAIARAARRSQAHDVPINKRRSTVTFTIPECTGPGTPPGTTIFSFKRGRNSVLHLQDCGGNQVDMMGGRSQVRSFDVVGVTSRLVRVRIDVQHTRGSRTENEVLETEIFLRNG